MATAIWEWCTSRTIWLSATHITRSENTHWQADRESRELSESTEWSLSQGVFKAIKDNWGPFDIHLFASRLNLKVSPYVSWQPDPRAQCVNVFFMDWKLHCFYAFPLFSVIANCLQKIEQDQSLWTTQPWFTLLWKLLKEHSLLLPQLESLLLQPQSKAVHPLRKRLQPMACKLSGNPSNSELFQAKPPTSSCSPGQLWHEFS